MCFHKHTGSAFSNYLAELLLPYLFIPILNRQADNPLAAELSTKNVKGTIKVESCNSRCYGDIAAGGLVFLLFRQLSRE